MDTNIVVIAEYADNQISPVTYEIISFAMKLQRSTQLNPVKVLLLADEVKNPAQELASRTGLDVIAIHLPEMNRYNGEIYLQVLTDFLPDLQPGFICIAHSSQGQDFAPALAINLNAACITGIEDFFDHSGAISFTKSIYGGKITARLQSASQTSILTIQPGVFKADEIADSTDGNITVLAASTRNRRTRSLGIKQAERDTTGINEANVIVAAGRGIGEKENLDCIRQLAALFTNSAVAGSRIVCDLGWLGYQCQVGVTGTTVSPKLYIACGISGAVQHVTGMQNSEFIVAINKDPSAAIFQSADIGIVEDLKTFISAFIRAYNEANNDMGE